mgnify:CR=1 FL=1
MLYASGRRSNRTPRSRASVQEKGRTVMVEYVEDTQEEGRGTRLAVTAGVAIAAVALVFAAWMLAGSAFVVLAGLYVLAKRFMRVAANQNKNPLG